jgi:anthranilate phosphoribosyltransferase
LKDGAVSEYTIHPSAVGLAVADVAALKVANAAESKERIIEALSGKPGPVRDIVLLNAGAALYAANVAGSVIEGVSKARAAVDSGAARAKLDQFVAFTRAA